MRTSRNVIVEPKCTFLGLLLELRLVQKRPSSIIVVLLLPPQQPQKEEK